MTTNTGDNAEFATRLQDCVTRDTGHETKAPHAVNQAMINMWADALIDDNPIYVDEEAARKTGRPGVVAPATMIQAWIMPPLSGMARAQPDVPGFAPYLSEGAAFGGSMAKNGDGAPNCSPSAIMRQIEVIE